MNVPVLEIGSNATYRALDARDHGIDTVDPFADWEDSMIAHMVGEDGERS